LIAMSNNERAHSLVPKSYSEQELDRFLDKLPVKSHKNGS
jgi:hypothetical protein